MFGLISLLSTFDWGEDHRAAQTRWNGIPLAGEEDTIAAIFRLASREVHVVKLLPLHSALLKIDDAVGHQVRNMNVQ